MAGGRWRIDPLNGGWMSLDGGNIFGLVPKLVWGKLLPCDEKNRIRVPNRCLLARRGKETVLIDSGYGSKYPRLDRQAYAMEEGNPIFRALERLGVAPGDVRHLVMTHLHFDHAGGATVFDEKKRLVPAFPKAKYYASAAEWDDAVNPIPELAAAYPQNNLTPLVEKKAAVAYNDGDEILPGLTMRISGGHTRGHAAAMLETEDGPAFFLGDLAPTAWHAKQLWTTAYDTFILETRLQKPTFFAEALDRDAAVFWAHDPKTIASKITERKGNNFLAVPILPETENRREP